MLADLTLISLISERHPILLKIFITEDQYYKKGNLNSHPWICALFRATTIPDKYSCIKFGKVAHSTHSSFQKLLVVQICVPFL